MTAALTQPPRVRVRVRPAPRREPPFEDEQPPALVLPRYDQPLPFERPPATVTPIAPGPRRDRLPDPAVWSRRLLIGLVESAAGRRPLHQLSALLSLSVCSGLGLDFERAALSGRPHWLHDGTVRTVRASEPADGVAEVCATIATRHRVHAVALRVEARRERWRCTRLQLG